MGKPREWSNDEVNAIINYIKTETTPVFAGSNCARDLKQFLHEWAGARVKQGILLKLENGVLKPVIPSEAADEFLTTQWKDPICAGAFAGAEKFYKTLQAKYAGITRARVEAFVGRQQTAQVHRAAPKHRIVRPIMTSAPLSLVQLDTTEYIDTVNARSWFIICAVDLYTKYAWVDAKTTPASGERVMKLLERLPPGISRVQTDNGAEFNNSVVNEWLIRRGIKHVNSLPYKSTSQGAVEKFNQTLKQRFAKFQYQTKKTLDAQVIDEFVISYNESYHDTTKGIPTVILSGAEKSKSKIVRQKPDNLPQLCRGDHVRVALNALNTEIRRDKFRKGYLRQWSDDIYKIYIIGKPREDRLTALTYRLTLNGVPQKQRFYRAQLLKVPKEIDAPEVCRVKSHELKTSEAKRVTRETEDLKHNWRMEPTTERRARNPPKKLDL